MKKNLKDILALFSLMIFWAGISMNVHASTEDVEVVEQVNYAEVTDVDELLRMGIEQKKEYPEIRSAGKDTLTVKQLLSVTEYEDGTIEKEFCINEIGAVDKEGERITAEQFAYSSGSNGNSATNYGVTLVCTIYATMRVSDVPSANQVTYRCDKVTSTLVRGGEIYPGTGTTEYCHTKGNEYKKAAFTASVAINQSYTLTANGGFYRSNDIPLTGGLWAQSFVNLSNGKSMTVQAGIPQDDPFK